MSLTFDKKTLDSTGAFLVSELERLDTTLHEPLWEVSWGRDINLRSDVTLADEFTSFMLSNYAAPGGINTKGKNWIAQGSTAIPGISVDLEKHTKPLRPWAMELAYSIFDLEKSIKLNRNIDAQKVEGIRIKYQMDIDEQVYVGDETLGATGLFNNESIPTFDMGEVWNETTSPDVILAAINEATTTAWSNSAYTIFPRKIILPPQKFALLQRPMESTAESIWQYIARNSVANSVNGSPLEIVPSKWSVGRGAANSDRMLIYTNEQRFVRFSLVPIARTALQLIGINHQAVYYAVLGEVEVVYPETLLYGDGF